MSGFWRTWMTVWCAGVGVFGLALAGAGFEATSGPARALFAILGDAGPLVLDGPLRFSIALMGALTIGWSLTLLTVARASEALGQRGRPFWLMTIASVLAWYVIDSGLSIATGFPLNALSNTLLVAAFLLPVFRSGVLGERPAGGARTSTSASAGTAGSSAS